MAERARLAGNAAFKAGQYAEALRSYERGLESDKRSLPLHADDEGVGPCLACGFANGRTRSQFLAGDFSLTKQITYTGLGTLISDLATMFTIIVQWHGGGGWALGHRARRGRQKRR